VSRAANTAAIQVVAGTGLVALARLVVASGSDHPISGVRSAWNKATVDDVLHSTKACLLHVITRRARSTVRNNIHFREQM
jgi:hypothetical protein